MSVSFHRSFRLALPRTLARTASLLAAGFLLFAAGAAAQPAFVEVTPPTDPLFVTPADEDFWVNAVAPADVDGDGDLDLAVLGFYVVYNVSATDMLVVFLNDGPDANGNWTFTTQQVPLGTLAAGASDLAWGDYDGDGDDDLAIATNGKAALYRNDGGTLTDSGTVLPDGYWEDSSYTGAYDLRSLTWADVDNDGDLDLLLPSVYDSASFGYTTRLLRNDGPGAAGAWTFTDTGASIDPTVHAQSAWADDDGDMDLDLFLTNVDPYTETGFVRRFQNDGGGVFTGQDLLGITVEYGLADWGDYDADSDMDILVAGNIQEEDGTYSTVLRIYTNTGAGYSENTLISAPTVDWLDFNAASWADYDSDGDMDLLVTGSFIGATEIEGKSEIYGNDGSGGFAPLGVALPAPIDSIGRGGTFTWLDLDGDGDLDYLVAGAYFVPGGNGLVEAQMHIYRNDVILGNSPPSAPSSPESVVQGNQVAISWEPAFDDSTPTEALTYELEVTPATAVAEGGAVAERLPEPGNLSAVTDWVLEDLPEGSYVWSVRAVDSAFNGGPAAQGEFTVGAGAALDLFVEGSCPGPVTVRVRNASPRSEVAVIASSNLNGFVKGGALCNGATLEIGEPLVLPPTWVRTDAHGNGHGTMTLEGEACWVEALDMKSCGTSGAQQASQQ